MNRAAQRRPTPLGRVLLAWLLAAPVVALRAQPMIDDGAAPALSALRIADYCGALASSPWPRAPTARRELLHRFEILRSHCMEHAGFLATLGALWLEEGEPEQALIWLERALLLNPNHLGALADHALALAAIGEPAALSALASEWAGRTDVPGPLRQRLEDTRLLVNMRRRSEQASAASTPNTVDGWIFYREATMLAGYETNLNQRAKLDGLTLTFPEGPITVPPEELVGRNPRPGGAIIADLAWQLAYSPQPGMIVQSGLQGNARAASAETESDWRHIQWAGSISQQWGQWRAQVQANVAWFGGQLSEPFRLARLGASVDREAIGCSHRASVESELRTQKVTHSADGRSLGATWSLQCPWPGSTTWSWGAALRHGLDNPSDPGRPGGVQRQTTFGVRLSGPVNNGTRLDASLKTGLVKDSEGYSELLENNAVRRINQTQFSLELSRQLQWSWLAGAEALVQFQAVRQSSNLTLFGYKGYSIYSGLRWRW